jgi:hypothetical protein
MSGQRPPPRPRPRRDCAFCGSSGPLTKEDAWPRWLNKAFPKPPPGVALDISLDGEAITRASRRTVTGYNTARVPGFCRNCNNGWMSQLEHSAAPLLLPMIRGEHVTLDASEQALIAAWVTKTALVFDQRTNTRAPFVSSDLTRSFAADRQPIQGSRVLLARYAGTDWSLNHAVAGLPVVYRDGREKVVVAIVTLSLGELAMQLICPTDFDEVGTTSVLARDDNRFAVQLEPARGAPAEWPPAVSLGSRDWVEFGLSHGTSVDISDVLSRIDPPTSNGPHHT